MIKLIKWEGSAKVDSLERVHWSGPDRGGRVGTTGIVELIKQKDGN